MKITGNLNLKCPLNEKLTNHEQFMKVALQQAAFAFEENEIPVGAVIVSENKIIARAYNQTQKLNDPTAHAEMLAITSACNNIGAKYLPKCELYVTLEPCVMCAGAIKWAQFSKIIFGAHDVKTGYSTYCSHTLFNQNTEIISGVLEKEARFIILEFFKKRR